MNRPAPQLKIRWQRLIRQRGHIEGVTPGHPVNVAWRLLEAAFLLADLLHFPELLMLLNRIAKPNTRGLTPREIALARSVFGEAIDYQKVRLDERSFIGCRQFRFAYVGFNFVNSWGDLSDPHFIHEMVHVWQYQRLGSVYIPRALWAQRTAEGYDYGGIAALQQAVEQGKSLADFNYEQQGDIAADYFCLKNGWKPRWCAANKAYLPVFEALIKWG
ncbi:MAG: hypothetical protein DYG98_11285 [Haliscomenobacteraceae bacterium CHB4]|nr:hypothetical protein [Saprospiraceae bacterium]MCE7923632.1 hypothetical protein [Haliscomenobacteraceae bacterium CHB4]